MAFCFHTLRTVRLCVMLPQSPCVHSVFPNQLCRYGYVTNSKVKFVMVVDSSNPALRDNEIRSVSAGGLETVPGAGCFPFVLKCWEAKK